MLVIRFQRTGRRNVPSFRLVVAEKSAAAKGKVMEVIGHYLPARDPAVFEFKRDRIDHWVKAGAQPSDTAARLLTKAGVPGLERHIVRYAKQKKKGEEGAGAAAPAVPAKTEAEAEAPAKSGASAEAPAKADDTAEKAA